MKYATPEAFRAALDQRIRNEAVASGVPVMRLRKRVAFERFLARLAVVDPQRWVLEGAFALDLRLGLRTRTTKDIDLAGADDERIATANLIAAQAIDLHDHFSFDVTRTPALDRAEAFCAGRLAHSPAKDRRVEADEHSGGASREDLGGQLVVRGRRTVRGSCQQLRLQLRRRVRPGVLACELLRTLGVAPVDELGWRLAHTQTLGEHIRTSLRATACC